MLCCILPLKYVEFFWLWNTTAFPFLSCYFSVLIWPLYSCIIVYLYARLPFCFISFWDKVVLFLSNHTSILREETYPPSLSSQKDSADFVTGRTAETWRWFMWLHHLRKNQATFIKSNQGIKRFMVGLVSGVAHWASELKYQEMSMKTKTWTAWFEVMDIFTWSKIRFKKPQAFVFLRNADEFLMQLAYLGSAVYSSKLLHQNFNFMH